MNQYHDATPCIAFDLDDTIYFEIDYVRSGFRAVSKYFVQNFGLDPSVLLGDRIRKRQLQNVFQDICSEYALPAEMAIKMVEVYRNHLPTIRPRPGFAELFQWLRSRRCGVACITDGRSVGQRNKLQGLGIDNFFDVILISEETGVEKPDPHNFRLLENMVQASTYIYVADNPTKDFVSPNYLGWKTIGILGRHTLRFQDSDFVEPGHRPLVWLEDFDSVVHWLSSQVPFAHMLRE